MHLNKDGRTNRSRTVHALRVNLLVFNETLQMKCKKCGYDSNKPIGKALTSAKKGKKIELKLNKNGLKGVVCGHIE